MTGVLELFIEGGAYTNFVSTANTALMENGTRFRVSQQGHFQWDNLHVKMNGQVDFEKITKTLKLENSEMKVKYLGQLFMNDAEIYSSYVWIESQGIFHMNGRGHKAEQGPGSGKTVNNEGYGAGHGGYGGAPNPVDASEPYGSVVTPHQPGSGGGNGLGHGGSGGGVLFWKIGQRMELNGLLALQGSNGINFNAGGGSGGSLLIETTNFTGHGEINVRGGDGTGTGGGGAGGRIGIHCEWRYSYGGKYRNRGGDGGPGKKVSHGAAAGTTYVENNFRPLEYRILKYMKESNQTYFRVDHLYVHIDNEGNAVPVATVIMEDQSEVFEFDEMEITGFSRVLIYHPVSDHVNLTVHRFIGDRTGQLHLRANQLALVEYVESISNVTEAPVSYIIDEDSEVIFPTEVHIQGINTTLAGLMTGVHHFYVEDKAVATVEASSQTALLQSGKYVDITTKGNFSLPSINVQMDGVLEFRKITNSLTITTAFLEIKYLGSVFMNHGYIDAGEIDMESGSQISLDAKGYRAGNGPGAGKGTAGGSYGGQGGCAGPDKPYGSLFTPSHLGSGGGGNLGGAGGGFVEVNVGRNIHVDGNFKTYGEDAQGSNSGGGSGGSILIKAFNFSGHGVLDASGGDGMGTGCGGSGGRIAAHIGFQNNFGGLYLAHGGKGGSSTNHTLSDGGPGTIYKYESNRGPQYRELKYNPRLNETLIKPEHSKLTVENANLKTINPGVVMEENSVYYEFDEVQVEGYAYVHFYHSRSAAKVTVVIHELTGNKKGMVRVQSNQQVLVNFVESTHTYLDAPCGFHVDRGGELVLPTTVFITSEQWILGGRLVGVEDLIIERGAELILIQEAHTKDAQSVDMMYLKSESDSFTPGVVQFGTLVVNNDGVLTTLTNPVKSNIMTSTTSVKNGGKIQMNSLYVIYSASYLEVEKGGLMDGEGQGFSARQGPGAGSAGTLDASGGSYASYGNFLIFI